MTDWSKSPESLSQLSRRDFLRFCSLTAAGLLLPRQILTREDPRSTRITSLPTMGRVTQDGFPLHVQPDPESRLLQELEMDSLWQITDMRINTGSQARNRIWYQLDGKGYAHSSRIQLVRQRLNPVNTVIPESGALGEVTVPFVDAYRSMDKETTPVYRFYFGSTYWIVDRLVDDRSGVWYKVLDDYYYQHYFVDAETIRLVPDNELTPLSPNVDPEDKRLVVDLTNQRLRAYEGKRLVYFTRISSGVRMEEGGFATPQGFYRTTHKRPCRHMFTPPSEFGTGFDLPGVPWVSYFTGDGVAFHGTYWHNDFGVPHSHGCINLRPLDAKWVYRWTNPNVPPDRYFYSELHGTRVVIHKV